ncbi:MAG: chlorite dismutase family protein [SAR202 cluster bacterium]|nr:chlorite dismutase family protein [SAR202 cluster bacterium]
MPDTQTREESRQFVKYTFYKLDPLWRRLPDADRAAGKNEFAAVVNEFAGDMVLRSYSCVGMRGDVDFLLWQGADSLEQVQEVATRLNATALGKYLTTPHSYLAMTRRSQYVKEHRHEGQEGTRLKVTPGHARYFFVYPFVKTHEWYTLPAEDRQRMMSEHFRMGHKYPSVKINTSYSFGLDDPEFMVAFESDSPSDFLELVMEMRGSEARKYTERDTPIFTCVYMPIEQALDTLGG